MSEDYGYGGTTASHEPDTEAERPDPEEQKEAAGRKPPVEAGDTDPEERRDRPPYVDERRE